MFLKFCQTHFAHHYSILRTNLIQFTSFSLNHLWYIRPSLTIIFSKLKATRRYEGYSRLPYERDPSVHLFSLSGSQHRQPHNLTSCINVTDYQPTTSHIQRHDTNYNLNCSVKSAEPRNTSSEATIKSLTYSQPVPPSR